MKRADNINDRIRPNAGVDAEILRIELSGRYSVGQQGGYFQGGAEYMLTDMRYRILLEILALLSPEWTAVAPKEEIEAAIDSHLQHRTPHLNAGAWVGLRSVALAEDTDQYILTTRGYDLLRDMATNYQSV